MDNTLVWHVFWNNVPIVTALIACTSLFWNMFRGLKVDIKNENAELKQHIAKSDARWEATNARIDNTYTLILEEIRSRKQEKH